MGRFKDSQTTLITDESNYFFQFFSLQAANLKFGVKIQMLSDRKTK